MPTIEELAQAVIELTPEDLEALVASSGVETATFEEYFSEYMVVPRVCKGCHGG